MLAVGQAGCSGDRGSASGPSPASSAPVAEDSATEPTVGATTTTSTTTVPDLLDARPSDERSLTLAATISDDGLQPKSVVHSGGGLFFAQNMMYRHSISVYDRTFALVGTIDDRVDLGAFGAAEPGRASIVRGSPVEAAFAPDGATAWVSNYKMYGDGWRPVADDECQGREWDPSFVYRIDVGTLAISGAVRVGAVPKYLAASPDGRWLLVSNFCSQDLSVVDVASGTEVRRILVGLHPRGIAISSDSTTAFVAVMGAAKVVRIDLATWETVDVPAGPTPRHLVLSPDDRVLYVTNNRAGTVRSIDAATGSELAVVATGRQPRSMAISDDGRSLWVVNYADDTLVKVGTATMTILQEVRTRDRPVGVTYDPVDNRVWVANYSGSLGIYDDR